MDKEAVAWVLGGVDWGLIGVGDARFGREWWSRQSAALVEIEPSIRSRPIFLTTSGMGQCAHSVSTASLPGGLLLAAVGASSGSSIRRPEEYRLINGELSLVQQVTTRVPGE